MHPGPNPYPISTPPTPRVRTPTRALTRAPPLTHDQWVLDPNPNDDDVRSDDPSHDCDLVHALTLSPALRPHPSA